MEKDEFTFELENRNPANIRVELHPITSMLALSWKQPFASLMLHGKIETRTWKTNYRGLVLICSSKKPYSYKIIKDISGEAQYQRIMDKTLDEELFLGSAIAVGNLVDCRPMQPDDEEKTFVAYRDGLYCHIYENVKPIKPFIWKGTQGWKKVSQDIINKIEYL